MKVLINNGNTCFFNVSLKLLLSACPELENQTYEGDCVFTQLFFRFVKVYFDPAIKHIDPRPLLEVFREKFPRFVQYEQHDVQECLLCLIDILENELPYFKQKFYGIKENQVIYPEGKNYSTEKFSMHILESKRGATLAELNEKSFKWNVIENYQDENGKVFNLATRRSIIKEFPEIFMISFDSKSEVEIFESDNNFELLSSAIHLGGQQGGHYICLLKQDDKWYVNDEDFINELTKFPTRCGHYVIMYKLKK